MIYLALDTCVWLNIIKHDPYNEFSLFNELLFWIEHKHISCITTPNLLREWNRNKSNKKKEVVSEVTKITKALFRSLESIPSISTTLQPDKAEAIVDGRISRVDHVFATLAIVAKNEEEVYEDAIKRSLNCIAPSFRKDSFRDTVNILHVLSHVKEHQLTPCYFTTSNYTDFSADENRSEIHPQLQSEFSQAGLEYIYFHDDPKQFAKKFVSVIYSHGLASYSDYLNREKIKKKEQVFAEKKIKEQEQMNVLDPEFIYNIQYIDLVVGNKEVSDIEKGILKILFDKHPKYKEYFMKKLGENGLV